MGLPTQKTAEFDLAKARFPKRIKHRGHVCLPRSTASARDGIHTALRGQWPGNDTWPLSSRIPSPNVTQTHWLPDLNGQFS